MFASHSTSRQRRLRDRCFPVGFRGRVVSSDWSRTGHYLAPASLEIHGLIRWARAGVRDDALASWHHRGHRFRWRWRVGRKAAQGRLFGNVDTCCRRCRQCPRRHLSRHRRVSTAVFRRHYLRRR